MKRSFRRVGDLLDFLDLTASNQSAGCLTEPTAALEKPQRSAPPIDLSSEFPLFVPREYASRIMPRDWSDPLLRQILPLEVERSVVEGDRSDPVGDLAAQALPGLIHKYSSRVLLISTGACAVNCRYCFRRHFPYGDAPKGIVAWEPVFAEIADHPEVNEVILSGGDPLTLSDIQLSQMVQRIEATPQIKRLRLHTRVPVVIPQRVCDELIAWVDATRLSVWVVLHINHAREIDDKVETALKRLRDSGVHLLNQSVLLRGVNDSADALVALSERLLDCGVLPYYLHQLDRVAGASHFEVPVQEGRQIIESMRARLPGYAVPQWVREIEGEPSKRPIEFPQVNADDISHPN